MYEQRDTSVPRKHHAAYRNRNNWVQLKPEAYKDWSIVLHFGALYDINDMCMHIFIATTTTFAPAGIRTG